MYFEIISSWVKAEFSLKNFKCAKKFSFPKNSFIISRQLILFALNSPSFSSLFLSQFSVSGRSVFSSVFSSIFSSFYSTFLSLSSLTIFTSFLKHWVGYFLTISSKFALSSLKQKASFFSFNSIFSPSWLGISTFSFFSR